MISASKGLAISPYSRTPYLYYALRSGVVLILLLSFGCSTIHRDDNTLSNLNLMTMPIEDEQVNSTLEKKIQIFRMQLQQKSSLGSTYSSTHEPDVYKTETYHIPGIKLPPSPGAQAAITHYSKILTNYPLHDQADQMLYQLSRAYDEMNNSTSSTATLMTIATDYPEFEYIDEVNFRLAEHHFREKKYLPAIRFYKSVLHSDKKNRYYEASLNKLGWSYFKQDNYVRALDYFMTLFDHINSDRNNSNNKQLTDILHAISLSFSHLGGAEAIKTYSKANNENRDDSLFYKHLAEYYFSKQRYSDAANTYDTYIKIQPYSERSPYYAVRIIEIYQQGNFTNLTIDYRKRFAKEFDSDADYWNIYKYDEFPKVYEFQKENIHVLARHYHAAYQNSRVQKEKVKNYTQAIHWYWKYYYQFPLDKRSPEAGKLRAELFLENNDFRSAALEFERTAYNYPASEIAPEMGYAAIFAYRENLKTVATSEYKSNLEDVARSSLKFIDKFPGHKEASAVLTAAANDLLILKNYTAAASAAWKVISMRPQAEIKHLQSARIILADASFETKDYEKAEMNYSLALNMTDIDDVKHKILIENLVSSIYKQGEEARSHGNDAIAAQHFQRVATLSPSTSVSISAQYDAAAALVAIEDWSGATNIFEDFLIQNPNHKLAEVTKRNLAVIYKKNGELLKAAREFELIGKTSKNVDIRRDALLQAAELYRHSNNDIDALRTYKHYLTTYPRPIEDAIESHQYIAEIYKSKNNVTKYSKHLNEIVTLDAGAGKERTERTRHLASQAQLILAEKSLNEFKKVTLTKPFKHNLKIKKDKMASALNSFTKLLEYEIDEVTTAATYYIGEIYLHFSHALTNSERPTDLNALELEQYELALDEQSYIFEDKAISVHEKNTELLALNIYDKWIVKSITRLSELFPARYAKDEQNSGYMKSLFATDDRT